jgi:hypothetical protein
MTTALLRHIAAVRALILATDARPLVECRDELVELRIAAWRLAEEAERLAKGGTTQGDSHWRKD